MIAVNDSRTKPMGSTPRPNNVRNKQTTTANSSRPTNPSTTPSWYARSVGKSDTQHEIAETEYQQLRLIETYPTRNSRQQKIESFAGILHNPRTIDNQLTRSHRQPSSQPKLKSTTTGMTCSTMTNSNRIQKTCEVSSSSTKPDYKCAQQTTD